MKNFVILIYVFIFSIQLHAQDKKTPSPIIFIYDASGSMWEQMQGRTKMEIASEVLSNSVNNLPENQKIGLVAYGHRKEDDCQDVEFLVDVENGTKAQVNQSLTNIKPLGKTPLAYSMMQVIEKLRNSKMKATVILVTDGMESCNGNICEVVTTAKSEGIDFRLHVIGFGLKEGESELLKCAANASDGLYYDAEDAEGLDYVLNQATNTTVDDAAGNFSVYIIKNGKPVDAYVKVFNAGTQISVKIVRTYSDSAFIYLPPGTYDLEVKPLEGSDVSVIMVPKVQSFEDKTTHQTISFDGAKINITTLNNGEGWDATIKIYERVSGKNVADGRTYGKAAIYEVNPGMYDIEVTALSMNGLNITYLMENVEVKANELKVLEHNFKSGTVMIGANSSGRLVDATINILEANSKENVAGGRTYTSANDNPKKFILSPGTYEVILNALGEYEGKKETFTIIVKEGETVEKITSF